MILNSLPREVDFIESLEVDCIQDFQYAALPKIHEEIEKIKWFILQILLNSLRTMKSMLILYILTWTLLVSKGQFYWVKGRV